MGFTNLSIGLRRVWSEMICGHMRQGQSWVRTFNILLLLLNEFCPSLVDSYRIFNYITLSKVYEVKKIIANLLFFMNGALETFSVSRDESVSLGNEIVIIQSF